MRPTLLILLSVAFFACEKHVSIDVSNPVNVVRPDEVIVLTKKQVSEKFELKDGLHPVIKEGEKTVPTQVDDLDGDGIWDEVVFVTDFSDTETKTVGI